MYIKVRVTPGARRERINRVSESVFEIHVKEEAELNAANHRVQTILAEVLCIASQRVRLVSGHRKPSKKFEII